MCSSWGGGKENKESESNGLRGDELQNCILKTPCYPKWLFSDPFLCLGSQEGAEIASPMTPNGTLFSENHRT